MSGAYHGRMIFIIKSGRSEIDQIDVWTQKHPSKLRTPSIQRTTAGYVPVVCESLVIMVEEKDILRLKIGMNEVEVVKEGYRAEQLACEGLDVRAGKWYEAAVLEEVEDTQAQQRRHYTNVAAPVEALLELNAGRGARFDWRRGTMKTY